MNGGSGAGKSGAVRALLCSPAVLVGWAVFLYGWLSLGSYCCHLRACSVSPGPWQLSCLFTKLSQMWGNLSLPEVKLPGVISVYCRCSLHAQVIEEMSGQVTQNTPFMLLALNVSGVTDHVATQVPIQSCRVSRAACVGTCIQPECLYQVFVCECSISCHCI